MTNLTLVLADLLLLRVACHRHAEATQPPVGEGQAWLPAVRQHIKAFCSGWPVWIGSVSERADPLSKGRWGFHLWPTWVETCAQMQGCGSLHPDYHSLINSPGHVVYIFRCKVEGLYLWMARFESTERERMLCWITLKRKLGHIATISIWIEQTAEINRPHNHYCRVDWCINSEISCHQINTCA